MIYSSPEYCQTALKMLNEMRQNNEFCDILLSVNDNKYAAHRAVLVAGSQYMRHHLATLHGNLLKLQMQLSNSGVFEDVLNFMYTGKICLTKNNIAEMSMIASHLQINAITTAALEFLNGRHDVDVGDSSNLEQPIMEVTIPDDYEGYESFNDVEHDPKQTQSPTEKKRVCKKSIKLLPANSTLMVIDKISKRFKCSLCGKSFARKLTCLRHCQRHCVCSQCGKAFETEISLKNHLKSKTCVALDKPTAGANASVFLTKNDIIDGFRFKCDTCFKMFQIFDTYRLHRQTAHNIEELLTCAICNESFDTGDSLCLHISNHYLSDDESSDNESVQEKKLPVSTSKFSCKFCGKEFNEPEMYNNHLLSQCKTTGLPCPVCHKLFSCKPSLQRHLKKRTRQVQCGLFLEKNNSPPQVKTKKKVGDNLGDTVFGFLCKDCELGFENFAEFSSHRNEQHGVTEEMKCRFCGLVFEKEMWINKHIEYHVHEILDTSENSQTTYKCTLCNLEYDTKYEFEAHKTNSCTDECRFCRKHFKSRTRLESHVQIHLRKTEMK